MFTGYMRPAVTRSTDRLPHIFLTPSSFVLASNMDGCWEKHKDEIRMRYYSTDQNVATLKSIMAHMKDKYNFDRGCVSESLDCICYVITRGSDVFVASPSTCASSKNGASARAFPRQSGNVCMGESRRGPRRKERKVSSTTLAG